MTVASRKKTPEEVARALTALPPLPSIALRVMQVAQDPKSSAAELALVVSADPGLTATVLRVANSAAYRRAQPVTSIQQALVLLGFMQARNIAISSSITGSYAPDAANALFRIDAFWRHSLAVALRASEEAGRSGRIDAPTAFTAGIVHNMGRLAMFYADPAGLDQAVAEAMRTGVPLEQAELEMLGYDHAEMGQQLGQKWKLPEAVCEAVGSHHTVSGPTTLGGLIAASDAYCCEHGVLPGYVIPGLRKPGQDAVFERLIRQVDGLMETIIGQPVGVRFDN